VGTFAFGRESARRRSAGPGARVITRLTDLQARFVQLDA
jgi:hypothetical protein